MFQDNNDVIFILFVRDGIYVAFHESLTVASAPLLKILFQL